MYVLIERDRLPEGRHYERMPDGRCIVSGREAKMFGSLDGVTLVPDAATLNALRTKMLEEARTDNGDEALADGEKGGDTAEEPLATAEEETAPEPEAPEETADEEPEDQAGNGQDEADAPEAGQEEPTEEEGGEA